MDIDDGQKEKLAKWLGAGSINIFGWPFSGKDTQGRRLADLFDAPLIGGGEILRSAEGVPSHVRQIIDRGELAPTQDYLNIVTPYLSKSEFKSKPVILSSVGRWDGEQQVIFQATSASGHPIKAVIYLELNESEARKRWEAAQVKADRGQRADDAEEVLATRFSEFRNKTLPVIEFYRQKGLLIEIDGSMAPDKVTAEIFKQLTSHAN
jgi:adenylate kinase